MLHELKRYSENSVERRKAGGDGSEGHDFLDDESPNNGMNLIIKIQTS